MRLGDAFAEMRVTEMVLEDGATGAGIMRITQERAWKYEEKDEKEDDEDKKERVANSAAHWLVFPKGFPRAPRCLATT